MKSFQNKIAVITGAGSGIGRILGPDAKIVNLIRNLFPKRYTHLLNPMFAFMMQGNKSE